MSQEGAHNISKVMVMNREFEIVKASIYGIVGNLLLVAFKMAVGFASHSIAIILDGVNNATDALSSIITIVGTKLAGRRPDRRHPFGYGRVEYLTSVVIAVIILVAGLISLRESVVKIIHPGTPSYSVLTITVIVVAILAKIFIGIMFKRFGDKTDCEALIASGVDSNYDAVLSAGTLVVAAAQNSWGLNIDGIVGLIISLVVCKAGIEVLRDALAPIIGLPEDKKLVEAIEAYANGFPEVRGTYDVVLDNFGPNEVIGSLHIEVDDDMNAREIHALTRKISEGLAEKFRIMATVGVYAANTTGAFAPMRADLEALAKKDPKILQVHGFYVDDQTKTVYFDMMIDFHADDDAIRTQVVEAMKKKYPAYTYNVVVDTDYED
ncbi:cation transporter [Adlercreutzia caecimuris]|uniref:Cation transporter n=2 Tax=Adlercreutzia caecimuris TaxID=671266 RepID=A0A4S4G511_9ACTN|nr:cation transporter [Adlercreutzia caecimuris]